MAHGKGLAAASDAVEEKYYLSHWETLYDRASTSRRELGASAREPDVYTQMPVTKTTEGSRRLRY